MEKLTQKYAIAQLYSPMQPGDEFAGGDWPLHVTIADVFAMNCSGIELLRSLEQPLAEHAPFQAPITGNTWFGETASVHVWLLDKTPQLSALHDTVLATLQSHDVTFNHPEFTRNGFRPHATIRPDGNLRMNDTLQFHELTLIDMFPDANPNRRRIIGSVQLGK